MGLPGTAEGIRPTLPCRRQAQAVNGSLMMPAGPLGGWTLDVIPKLPSPARRRCIDRDMPNF